jgi:Putative Actinobacterial Holin-X, holin superfamily III
METPTSQIESLFEKLETYGQTTYALSKLQLLETSTVIVTALVSQIGIILMLLLFVLMLNFGIALWLGDILGKPWYGFGIVAVFDLLAGAVLHFFLRSWLKKPVSDLIIRQAIQ